MLDVNRFLKGGKIKPQEPESKAGKWFYPERAKRAEKKQKINSALSDQRRNALIAEIAKRLPEPKVCGQPINLFAPEGEQGACDSPLFWVDPYYHLHCWQCGPPPSPVSVKLKVTLVQSTRGLQWIDCETRKPIAESQNETTGDDLIEFDDGNFICVAKSKYASLPSWIEPT